MLQTRAVTSNFSSWGRQPKMCPHINLTFGFKEAVKCTTRVPKLRQPGVKPRSFCPSYGSAPDPKMKHEDEEYIVQPCPHSSLYNWHGRLQSQLVERFTELCLIPSSGFSAFASAFFFFIQIHFFPCLTAD